MKRTRGDGMCVFRPQEGSRKKNRNHRKNEATWEGAQGSTDSMENSVFSVRKEGGRNEKSGQREKEIRNHRRLESE